MTRPRLLRSLLYVPGNMPSMLQNMPVFGCDAVIIDLEDAVPHTEKDAARRLVRRFLEGYRDRDKEILVRINALDTPWAQDDLREVIPGLPDGVRLPKADTPEVVERLDTLLTELEEERGLYDDGGANRRRPRSGHSARECRGTPRTSAPADCGRPVGRWAESLWRIVPVCRRAPARRDLRG